MSNEKGLVKITHTSNQGVFDVAGLTVATIQERLADVFNIPIQAFAFINGKIVGEEYRLQTNDDLWFSLLEGQKGSSNGTYFNGIKTPFSYFGSKAKAAPEVWRRFGDVKNYVEPFFGSGAVLLNRPKQGQNRIETVNDIDALLVNFWRSLKLHPRKLANAANYPVSQLDFHARQSWLVRQRSGITKKLKIDEAWCDPKVAAWWVWGLSQCIGGGWCATSNPSKKQIGSHVQGIQGLSYYRPGLKGSGVHRRTISLPKHYLKLAQRLKHVRILNGDWSKLVTHDVTTRYSMTGVLLDPPYTEESGRKKGLYAQDDLEVGHEVRDWAVANGDNPKLRIALCGYEGEYQMPPDWSMYEWKATGSKNGSKERIWFSPNCLK